MNIITGTAIGRITARDCDTQNPFNILQYFISQNSSSLALEYFDIRSNGDVYVRQSLLKDEANTLRYVVGS